MKKLIIILAILTIFLSACGSKPAKLEEISVKTPPYKLNYIYGEKLDLKSGSQVSSAPAQLELKYSDGSTKDIDITLDMCDITDVYKIGGGIPVTVTYNEGDIVKTATFDITCSAPAGYYAGNGFYFSKPGSWAEDVIKAGELISFNLQNTPNLTVRTSAPTKYTEEFTDAALLAKVVEIEEEQRSADAYGDCDGVAIEAFISFETKTNVLGFSYTVVLTKGAETAYYFKRIYEAPGNNITFFFYAEDLSQANLDFKESIFNSIIIVNN